MACTAPVEPRTGDAWNTGMCQAGKGEQDACWGGWGQRRHTKVGLHSPLSMCRIPRRAGKNGNPEVSVQFKKTKPHRDFKSQNHIKNAIFFVKL